MKPWVVLGVFIIIMVVGLHIEGKLVGWQAPGICFGVIIALSAWALIKNKLG